jgi:hypothetical protein
MLNNNTLRCNCCTPAQTLQINGQNAYCPRTEKLQAIPTTTPTTTAASVADFYPGRRRAEAVPLAINPAKDRFGS